jgi:hypothetical protein
MADFFKTGESPDGRIVQGYYIDKNGKKNYQAFDTKTGRHNTLHPSGFLSHTGEDGKSEYWNNYEELLRLHPKG